MLFPLHHYHSGKNYCMGPAARSFRAELHAVMGNKVVTCIETLSREISRSNGACIIEKEKFIAARFHAERRL